MEECRSIPEHKQQGEPPKDLSFPLKIRRIPTKAWGCRFIESDYIKGCKVGRGSYGEVYKGFHKKTGQIVALKRLNLERAKEGFPIDAINEIKHLRTLKHPNVLHLLEVVVDEYMPPAKAKQSLSDRILLSYPWNFYIVTEYAEHTLSGLLERGCCFDSSQVKCILKQLLEGLMYMHEQCVMHRDIKCSNILVKANGVVKLADLGMSTNFTPNKLLEGERGIVTLWYRAPELLCAANYSTAIDMWALGCVMGKLLMGEAIFRGNDEKNQLHIIMQELAGKIAPFWKKLKLITDHVTLDLTRKMLELNPQKRITAKEALAHPYFSVEPRPCRPNELRLLEGDSHELLLEGNDAKLFEEKVKLFRLKACNNHDLDSLSKAKKRSLITVDGSSPVKKTHIPNVYGLPQII